MQTSHRTRLAAVLALTVATTLLPLRAEAQRADSYTWKLGFEAGTMIFQTRSQDTKAIPSAGAHVLIMARQGGLIAGVDEGFGKDESTSGGAILFNDLRRYQAVMMAFPFHMALEPYFGVGGGIMTVVGPRINPALGLTDPTQRADLLAAAKEASASGFLTALAGIQGRWGRVTAFAQYQLASAPSDDKLLRGSLHTLHGGIRVGLGSAKDGVKAGGY
jgi:hypothetical protein